MKEEMRAFYDEEEDILHIAKEGEEEEFIEVQPGIGIELDRDRQVIGMIY
jgi:uncharacterized protein YuzE